eukprot:g68772.t1
MGCPHILAFPGFSPRQPNGPVLPIVRGYSQLGSQRCSPSRCCGTCRSPHPSAAGARLNAMHDTAAAGGRFPAFGPLRPSFPPSSLAVSFCGLSPFGIFLRPLRIVRNHPSLKGILERVPVP